MPITIDKPSKYFNTVLYTGDGTSPRSITGVGFKPDLVWSKQRSASENHNLYDAVRGGANSLRTNLTNAENASSIYGYVSTFDTDGVTYISGGTNNDLNNANGTTFVNWNWLGANTTASNTQGTITSTVSANTTSGFSIVSYTGDGSSSATVGHSLGSTPSMIIIKARAGTNASNNWYCWHKGLSANNNISLNTTSAQFTTATASSGIINTSPTSTTFGFTAGSGGVINVNETSTTYIAYCFAEVKGFSKFGSYVGNGNSDGTFVYTGFKPAWVMTKERGGANSWHIHDNKRNLFNVVNTQLKAESSGADDTPAGGENSRDFLSNGFKFRNADHNNQSGQTYIYMAFADNPFVSSKGIPCTAR